MDNDPRWRRRALLASAAGGGNAILLSLPLVSWGAASNEHGLRCTLLIAFGALLAVADSLASDNVACRCPGEPSKSDIRYSRLAFATGIALLLLFWCAQAEARFLPTSFHPLPLLVGGLLMVTGMAIRTVAIVTLGCYFRSEPVVAAEQQLVSTGIYRWLRHPSETGLLFAAGGAAILLQSMIAIGIWLILLIPLCWLRLTLEESALLAAFGEQYGLYQARVPAILPWRMRRS